jgi:S-adenosylmethionine:tRNA ribosyltransferase-isomerase
MGETPLPRYITRPVEPSDEERYQTIFATNEGAVVAPSAALHFSRELLKLMEINDIHHTFITLHASLGNFREIDVEDLTKHKTDSEQLIIGEEACEMINSTQDKKRRICAIGTTVMRALETAVCTEGHVKTYDGWTNKFIFPPYDFTVANAMVANFYAPESQLLMMTAAFGGYENVMNAYDVAVKEGYKFGCYGDAMLII